MSTFKHSNSSCRTWHLWCQYDWSLRILARLFMYYVSFSEDRAITYRRVGLLILRWGSWMLYIQAWKCYLDVREACVESILVVKGLRCNWDGIRGLLIFLRSHLGPAWSSWWFTSGLWISTTPVSFEGLSRHAKMIWPHQFLELILVLVHGGEVNCHGLAFYPVKILVLHSHEE